MKLRTGHGIEGEILQIIFSFASLSNDRVFNYLQPDKICMVRRTIKKKTSFSFPDFKLSFLQLVAKSVNLTFNFTRFKNLT